MYSPSPADGTATTSPINISCSHPVGTVENKNLLPGGFILIMAASFLSYILVCRICYGNMLKRINFWQANFVNLICKI